MFSIEINGKEVECEINFGTALDYELQFGHDMIADVNGSTKQGESGFITFDDKGAVIGVDFAAVPWTTLIRVLWCAAKTRNPALKPLKKWAAETSGIDILSARQKIEAEMEECFFRNSFVAPEAEPESDGK